MYPRLDDYFPAGKHVCTGGGTGKDVRAVEIIRGMHRCIDFGVRKNFQCLSRLMMDWVVHGVCMGGGIITSYFRFRLKSSFFTMKKVRLISKRRSGNDMVMPKKKTHRDRNKARSN
jgi:hypothetical protein